MESKINEFVKRLGEIELSESATNLYKVNSEEGELRVNNLTLYLTKMYNLKPKSIIVGEAAGYKGCRLTGIPFTSERIIKTNPFFTNDKSFMILGRKRRPVSEQSATIVWGALEDANTLPLIWNIFPFHPYNSYKGELSNRKPNLEELEKGGAILKQLLNIFETVEHYYAIGRQSERIMNDLNLNPQYIRHPANRGKAEFVEGIERYIK